MQIFLELLFFYIYLFEIQKEYKIKSCGPIRHRVYYVLTHATVGQAHHQGDSAAAEART